MKITVRLFVFYVFALAGTTCDDLTQIEKYNKKTKTYKLDLPGKDPITIIENTADDVRTISPKWVGENLKLNDKDKAEIKHLLTHIVHDFDGTRPRCFGPSCQEGYASDEEDGDDDVLTTDKLKDYGDLPHDRLVAISALAARLKKKDKIKSKYTILNSESSEEDQNGKFYTSWNRLNVKHHKHPYDDKDGWVTLEPVAWSTSKISKWKPNIKKQKPNHWDEDKFTNDDRVTSPGPDSSSTYIYTQKWPSTRPGFINNKLHIPSTYEYEIPSKPTWSTPQQASYSSTWASDEGRRPQTSTCHDHHDSHSSADTVYYGMTESLVTDNKPTNFPYEYEALHQTSSMPQQRPFRKPTPVVYAGTTDYDNDRVSRPPYGDGQWVLLSTTKGYRTKKRQRALTSPQEPDDLTDSPTMTSHQAVALTVLPLDKADTNMTTSHGGLLEVEKSFQTVEESKRDMDKKNDLDVASTNSSPVHTTKRVLRRKIVSNVSPDSSTLLAAVGAGMVPATMAMVVPMMLGKRRRREISRTPDRFDIDDLLYKYQR